MTSCSVVAPLLVITNISIGDRRDGNRGVNSTLATRWPQKDGMSENVFQNGILAVTGCQKYSKVTSIEMKEIMEWTYHRSVSMALD